MTRTREDEIINASIAYANEEFPEHEFVCNCFASGAKWADDNPKEDLINIEKAKIWVRNAFAEYFGNELANNIANEFIKAMEE